MRMIASAAALLLGLLAAGCNGELVGGGQRPPARMDVISGDLQNDTVGKELAQPLVVRVLDDRDRPVRNQLVNFVVTAGGGSVFAGSAITNAQGEARERWTLGPVAGDTQRVEARAVDAATGQALVFATFRAVGVPDVLAGLVAVGPTARTGTAEDPLADSLAVRAVDRHGNGIAGVQVQWAALEGGGTLSPATSTTDAAGIARSSWTLGPAVGSQAAQASAAAGAPVRFTATAGALPAVRIAIAPEALSFSSLGDIVPLTVTAYNRNGAPIPGLAVMMITENAAVVQVTGFPAAVSQGNGTTRIIAALGDLRDTIPVTVRQVVTSLRVTPDSLALAVGATGSLTVRAADARDRPVADAVITFASTAPSVASVDGAGVVRGVAAGRTQVTVTSGTSSLTRPVRVYNAQLRATAIGAGVDHSCAIDDQGRTVCWGRWRAGLSHAQEVVPMAVGGPRLVSVDGGSGFSCGLAADGAAYCWGNNDYGQLGNGSSTASSTPVAVSGGHRFTSLAVGNAFACGITAGGSAFCWGAGRSGSLGNGQWENSDVPVAVGGNHDFTSLAAGVHHACGIAGGGAAYCWGLNEEGEVGVAPERCTTPHEDVIGQGCHNIPVPVSGQVQFRALALGYEHSCGLAVDGRAYCWGSNRAGKLGTGATAGAVYTPALVTGGHTFSSITLGYYTACATTSDGVPMCWGYNDNGQFGNGTTGYASEPVAVDRGRAFPKLVLGRTHACGIAANGAVYCWGAGAEGQMGDLTRVGSARPKPVVDPG